MQPFRRLGRYLAVISLLGVVALLASAGPALAAARVDPALTMRAE